MTDTPRLFEHPNQATTPDADAAPARPPSRSDTVGYARRWLSGRLDAEDPTDCPTCGRHARVYRRKLHATIARGLISLYRDGEPHPGWTHTPSLPGDTHEISHAAYWQLIEAAPQRRNDGGRAGYWRLTGNGTRFVQGQLVIHPVVLVFDGTARGWEGTLTDIRGCLGDRFDYNELMGLGGTR